METTEMMGSLARRKTQKGSWDRERRKSLLVLHYVRRLIFFTTRCDQLCRLDERGDPVCRCHEGYFLDDDGVCADMDECEEANGGCEQICVNKPGTHMCDCRQGFQASHSRFFRLFSAIQHIS